MNIAKLKWVMRAASTQKDQPQLNGVAFHGGLCSATDGHRLHQAQAGENDEDQFLTLACVRNITRAATAQKIKEVDIKGDVVQIGGVKIPLEWSYAKFPPIEKVIPKDFQKNTGRNFKLNKVDTGQTIAALGLRVKNPEIVLEFGYDRVEFTFGDFDGSMETKTEGFGKMKINGIYLKHAVIVDTQVYYKGRNDMICLENSYGIAVIMPRMW